MSPLARLRTPRRDRRRGLSLIEVTIGSAITAIVLVIGGSVVSTSASASLSSKDAGVAASRVQRSLQAIADVVRNSSLATFQSADGTPFSDGEEGSFLRLREIAGFSGTVQLRPATTVRLVVPAGETSGEVVLDDGVLPIVLARDVTAFNVSRSGSTFTLSMTTRSGPADDRRRVATGTLTVRPRNP